MMLAYTTNDPWRKDEMRCPNCGAEFEADERYGHYVTCGYCSSQIVLDAEALKIAGKMAALGLPRGPLSLSATGSIDSRGFQVIGRVRYGYRAGFWDEWHLLWEDGETAWVSQDEDRLVLEELVNTDTPKTTELALGDSLTIAGLSYRVRERGQAQQEGAEGQLPFAVTPGETIRYFDLVGEGRHATLEEDEDGWRAFIGRQLSSGSIKLDQPFDPAGKDQLFGERAAVGGQRQIVQRQSGRELALSCEACGASLGIPDAGATELACSSCGADVDLNCERLSCPSCQTGVPIRSQEEAAQLSCPNCHSQLQRQDDVIVALATLAADERPSFPLALGQSFHFEDEDYRVIGLVQWYQREEGKRYYWNDFLLYAPATGYRWLGEENGHWMLFDDIEDSGAINRPGGRRKSRFSYSGIEWQVFERGKMFADWVEGEMPWALAVGDSYGFLDCIAPPDMLSAEWDDHEISWSRGRYLSQRDVARALDVKLRSLPTRVGVGPAQPYQQHEFMRQSGPIAMGFCAILIALLLHSFAAGETSPQTIAISSNEYREEFVTEPFSVSRESQLCTLKFEAPVDNAWVYLDVAVLNQKDRPIHEFSAEMSYYHGVEGGESWSEGSRSDSVVLKFDEPGEYRLLLLGQCGRGEVADSLVDEPMFNVKVSLIEDVVLSRYYVTLLALALIWLLAIYLPRWIFSAQRWSDD